MRGSIRGQVYWLTVMVLGNALLSLVAVAQPAAEELHTAAAVRGLTVEQAQQPRRVRLRGVVTFFDE
ncbi:MAG: hypothetical protein WCS42_06085, partial [Verrucomicrobiota bacterium]